MSRHPAEIAQEIRKYPFFKSFGESLLLQVSTMVREVDFSSGTTLLEANSMNNKLFFLRRGVVDVLVEGEKVGELNRVGDVIGEMSVLSGTPVSAQIKAQTALQCFCISADDFAHVNPSQKDRLQFLLYRIYAEVLTDRLIKTNEKAKLYEITARELHQKKKELELVTSAQMNFLRSTPVTNQKKSLLIEPNKKQQNILKAAIGSTGVQLVITSNSEEAQRCFSQERPDVVFCDESCLDFLEWAHHQNYAGHSVLLVSSQIDFNRILKSPFVQNVISRDTEDRAGTIKTILTALTKILHMNYFGIEKYLAWGTEIKSLTVHHSSQRPDLKQSMHSHFKSLGIRDSFLDRIQVAAEEMLMNAIYDAPVDSGNRRLFNHLPRTTEVSLPAGQQASFRFGCDGNLLAVSVQDPFGSLPQETILKYLQSCYSNQGIGSSDSAGAGRGLHQIFASCDWTIFNVRPNESTEVIGLFDIDQKRDGLPLFNYFFVK